MAHLRKEKSDEKKNHVLHYKRYARKGGELKGGNEGKNVSERGGILQREGDPKIRAKTSVLRP